jgi:predicted nuclease of predicted toxin-antitoxin system
MKLFFDQNLSFKLVNNLVNDFPHSIHVSDIGLQKLSDLEIL